MTRLCARVEAADATTRAEFVARLRLADVEITPEAEVVLAAAPTVDEAMNLWRRPTARGPVLVVADTVTADEAARAVRAGVGGLLQSAHATPPRLADTLRSLHDGDGRLPHELLVRLLGSTATGDRPSPPVLTKRQVVVLRLMADGLDNVSIARSLSCSGHTVKNVVYELMTRLDARNRAHAVASAVRSGLI